MRVRILGPLEVTAAGRDVAIGGARMRALLIRLALDPGRTVTTESLSAALWPEEAPGDPAHAVQALVSRLRRTLPDPAAIASGHGGYRLDVPADAVDAVWFERLAADGGHALRAGDPGGAARLLWEALGLWRGEALADVADAPFAVPVIVRLNELRLTATEDRIAADQAAMIGRDLVAELRALTTAHPLRSRLRLLLLQALDAEGRPGEALSAYEQFRELLADQLGADPGPELQAVHAALLRGEPVARPARRPVRGNLRSPLSSFIGRGAERSLLTERLSQARLVTLTGPGGVGKTRLALTVAAEEGGGFPGGVWLAELAGLTRDDDVIPAVASSLGLAGTSADAVAEALSAGPALLVLDNCEHLLAGVASAVQELLGRCPSLRIVTTSREALRLPGEALCPVPPLDCPLPDTDPADIAAFPAVRLLAERAAAVAPGFAVTDANAGPVAALSRRLDGLPLAIELAAARLRTIPLAELAARLEPAILPSGSPAAVPRQRTLEAVIEWSWNLLADTERRAASRMAVFPGTITPASAAAVTGLNEAEALGLLAALADKSLLQLADGDEARYRMLETIRDFCLRKLAETGGLAEARAAHAAYFADLAERAQPLLRGAGQLPWLSLLAAERDNLLGGLEAACATGDFRTAVRLAVALGVFWTVTGDHGQAAGSVARALDIPGDPAVLAGTVPGPLPPRASDDQASPEPAMYRAAATALWALNVVLSGTQSAPRPRYPAAAGAGAGAWAGEPAEHPVAALLGPALALLDDDIAAARTLIAARLGHPDAWTRAMLLLIRALLSGNHGSLRDLERDFSAAAEEFRAAGERWGLAFSLGFAGYARTTFGEFDDAVAALDESVRLLDELKAADGGVMQRVFLADALRKRGDRDRARAELSAILAPPAPRADRYVGRPGRYVFHARLAVGELARLDGDLAEAARQYESAAADLARIPGSATWLAGFGAMIASARAHLEVARGDLAEAGRDVAHALAVGTEIADMQFVAVVAVSLARLRLAQGAPAGAARVLGAAHALRGVPDEFNPDVVSLTADLSDELGETGYQAAYAEGCALDRMAALALIEGQARSSPPRSQARRR